MPHGGELLTLQFGNFANHVGAHFWNLQDALIDYTGDAPPVEDPISHDVLFRAGETASGSPTYTPRLILYDLKNSAPGLNQEGALYGQAHAGPADPGNFAAWDPSRVERLQQPPVEPGPYQQYLQQLEAPSAPRDGAEAKSAFVVQSEHVRTWADYLRPHLHPRTVNYVPTHHHEDPAVPFDAFWHGRSLAEEGSAFMEGMEDRVRAYMEECDLPQGFQLFVDADTAFAGIAAGAVRHLRDEYGRKGIMCYGLHSPAHSLGYDPATAYPELDEEGRAAKAAQHRDHRIRSAAYMMDECVSHGAVYVPLSTHDAWQGGAARTLPGVAVDTSSRYHTSALLAAAVDSSTLPYRLHTSDAHFAHLMSALRSPISMAGVTSVLPFMSKDAYLSDTFVQLEAGDMVNVLPLSPAYNTDLKPHFAACALRGVQAHQAKPSFSVLRERGTMSSYDRCTDASEMLQRFLGSGRHATSYMARVVSHGLPVGTPFPDWFGAHGQSGRSVSVSMLTALEVGGAVKRSAGKLASTFLTMRHQPYFGASWEREEFEEMRQRLSDRLLQRDDEE